MPNPFAWKRLENSGSTCVSPRAGHAIVPTNAGFIMYGGMDGRRNDQGNPSPNSDLFLLKFGPQATYEWSMVELDPASQIPPSRTLHSATATSEDELLIFGGIHSATPFQALNDGWVLDATCMEWKKMHFKANSGGVKGSHQRRMTGLISARGGDGPMKGGSGRRSSSSGSRRRSSGSGGGKRMSFESLAGAATRAVSNKRSSRSSMMAGMSSRSSISMAGGSKKSWKGILQKKMGAMLQAPGGARAGMKMRPNRAGGRTSLMVTDEEQFHDDLVSMVSQSLSLEEPGAAAGGGEPITNVPASRSNHTASMVENTIILVGGHGGAGYQRRAFNDAWMLNLDNDRWCELACQGNPPAPRSGHAAFSKDGCVYVFGGWNNESQFNDLFMLDVENKDWSDLDLAWSVPRWNMALQLVEAIPSWRVFVFGGSSDRLGEGRSMGAFDRKIGVLNLGEQYQWDDPTIEDAGKGNKNEFPAMREHCAICYEPDESRLIIFGGWAYKWLDDVWQINVSSIVGPPYAIIRVEPPLGPVTGGQKVSIHGVGFSSTQGTVTVRFSSAKHFADVQQDAHIMNGELIECRTPGVAGTIGPKDCEVRLAIGIRDFTTTVASYSYFLDTIAEKSLVYGPGVLEEQQAGVETRLTIQARNKDGENRKSGRDEWVVSLQAKKHNADGKDVMKDLPFELIDLDNGRSRMIYTADEGDVVIHIKHVDDSGKNRPIRGSPFKPTFSDCAKNRANEVTGPLISSFLVNTLKSLEEFYKTTDAGITTKLREGQVKDLIKVLNHIKDMYDQEAYLILKQDEIFETLAALDREGLPNEKQLKLLKKVGTNITQLKDDCIKREKEIQPMVQKESDLYKKKIAEFEQELKTYQSSLKKKAYYFYKSGLELAMKDLDGVTQDLDQRDNQISDLQWIATNFQYPEEMNNSLKVMQQMREEIGYMRQLWEFEVVRIKTTETFLIVRWGQTDAAIMEEQIKDLFKRLKEIKVDKKCDAFAGMADVCKKWTIFCPLVGELRDPAMRARHWSQLMDLCGKSVTVTPNILLRDMWNMELHKYPDAVEDTADQAKQEAKMEKTLAKLTEIWSCVDFLFASHKGTDVMLMSIKDDNIEMLEENQVQVQNMFASRFLSTFETEVTYWQKTLANVSETSALLSEVQRSWAFLENLFIHSEEVKKELPDESERFVGIDIEVKELLKKGESVRSAKDFCNEPGIFSKLEKSQTQLTMCEKALNEFMDGKRRAFPRFYFMSSADLLDVLSNGNQPAKVVPQFPKFFIAIDSYDLEFPDGEKKRPQAISMNAGVGVENVVFPEPLPLLGKVEIYLDKCIEAFRSCLKFYAQKDLVTYMEEGCLNDGEKRGRFFRDSSASQVGLLCQLITWVILVEDTFTKAQGGDEGAVKKGYEMQHALLLELIKLTLTNLTKPQRTKIMCCITLDAHNRDVQDKLVQEKVNTRDAFQWQSMLKCVWVEEKEDAQMQICDARFWYGYEYLGNGPRLVVTPLTDRIYVTATQALWLCMGCAPAGPAGTGKTESTKDLANALAKACYVINAAPEMDYLTIGNIFKGLAASGSWGCFDEFNRLVPEVLSVCTVQFKAVCDAVKAKAKRFILQGDEINLDLAVGAYITMNPGYLGRSELPEGLKALFRPITVMVPDFQLIMSNMFMGEGFMESGSLGLKFATLYALNKDLLSKSNKYDWGMRAIKSVLVVAGGFKRADASLSEQAVLMRSLRDTNVAKIDGDDFKIFMGLLGDLFPGINPPRARDYEFEDLLVKVMEEDYGYTHDNQTGLHATCNEKGYLLLKITQLVELLAIRHCVFLMGPPGSFKSALWKVLKNAKTRVGDRTKHIDFSPKAISTNELYGYVNMATREWKDGILSQTMRSLGNEPDTMPKWILLDGDLDANWIESMNSVMDDNRLLTLPSNERITLKQHMKMIFEIRNLNYATPATATRAGIVCMVDYGGIQWRSYVISWIKKIDHTDPVKEQLHKLFDKYTPDTLYWMLKNAKIQVPMVDVAFIEVVCRALDSLLDKNAVEALEYWFVFCMVWAIGGIMSEVDGVNYRKKFSDWWKNEMKTIKFPSKGTVLDYFVKENRLEEWNTIVDTLEYSSATPMGEVTVPTSETVALSFYMKALMSVNHPIMLIGLAGCGKTQSCNGLLKSLNPEKYCYYSMNMSFYTDSSLLQTMMEIPLEKKAGINYGPPGKLQMIYFIDDLNMPALDNYGTQSAIELMKQRQDYDHWYDRQKISLKNIRNTQYLSCMNPTAGSFVVNERLQRHFWTCSVPFPEGSALGTIYSTFMKGHFERLGFKAPVQDAVSGVIKAALSLHEQVTKTFRKTAANFHYEFNIRHMSGVFSGLLQAKPTEFMASDNVEKLVLMWIHESERVYGDRLVSVSDLKKYRALAGELVKKMFPKFNLTNYFGTDKRAPDPLVFAPFSKGISEMEGGGCYDKIPNPERLTELLSEALREYNENNAAMDLVLFEDAMKHVGKVCRIISNPSGHPLMVGVGGSGRQSLSRLSAFTCMCIPWMIVISGAYGINELKDDIRGMYGRAGVKDEGVMWLFTDSQITNEKFLVFINDLLASGDIADLYPNEDKDAIRNSVRSGCKGAGIQDTPDNLWTFFIARIRKNLHMSLCFSPVGDSMRNRARKFPALVNCTVIDWFQPWPADALFNVAQKFLGPVEQLGEPDNPVRAGIVEFFPFSFDAVGKLSGRYIIEQRRFAYTTPKTFLELIKLYTGMLVQKVDALDDKKTRLINGLEKLRVTQEQVAGLEEVLKEKAVVVKEKAEAADLFAEQVGKEKAKVNGEAEKANVEAAKCAEISKNVSIQKASCQEDLAAAVPLVEQAEKALDILDKKDFQTLKALANPPGGVGEVCEAAMHLQAGIDPNIEVDKKGKVKDVSWKAAGKMMSDPGKFLQNLKDFKLVIDDSKCPQQNVDAAKKVKESLGETFTYEKMLSKSSAVAGLCEWIINIIMYYDVVIQVEPKKQALREATETLNNANTRLGEVKALVKELEDKLAVLVAEFDKAMAEKDAVMAEAQKCQTKLDMAQRLVGALSANGIIWEQTVQSAGEQLVLIPGESLVACSFASYLGVFVREYREEAVGTFVDMLGKKGVPLSAKPDPLGNLATEAAMAKWAGQGLPSDLISCQNGAIMTNSERWCLIIDPQTQGIVWIKNKEVDHSLQITRMGHKQMVPIFEVSIENGKSVLIENMGEGVDAVLGPVISRNLLKRGTGKRFLKLGDKEIPYSANFKLFMQTKLSNPHYPPEIQAECTIINFTVTEAGLEDQLLFLVVRLERPDLARLKSELIMQQNEFKVKLAELEALLLEKLANAEGDILDDVDLILSLEDAKKTSDEVKEKVVIAQETELKINETSENYRPTASRGALLFFLLMDLCKMHTFYKYSLDSFVMVVTRAINSVTLRKPKEPKVKEEKEKPEGDEDEDGEGAEAEEEEEEEAEPEEEEEEIIELTGKDLLKRVQLLGQIVTYFVFDYTRRGLLDADKLTVASMLALRVLVRTGSVTSEEVNLLISAPPDPSPPPMPESARSWLSEMNWAQLKSLELIPVFKTSSGALTQNLEQDSLGWKRWFAEEKAELADLPRSCRDISTFHRMFLLRVLRPDRIGASLTAFVIDNLGEQFVNQSPFNMDETYEESVSSTPFFFVLFPGTDPTPTVEALARKLGITEANGRLVNISMGQGQEQVALNALNKGAKDGSWIMLQNIHLMQVWLKQLERCLEIVEEFAHPEFRTILTSEPPSALQGPLWEQVPESILQKCIKVADEAPTDLKSNLRRAYSKFSQANIDACLKPKEFKATVFALCFFHALLCGRIKFGAQGWTKKYPFNDGDLTICGQVLANYLNNAEKLGIEVPWPDLRYIFGEIMYGGHITDPWDRRVDVTYLAILIIPELLNNMNLAPGFKSPDASKLEYVHYVKYIDEKFPPEIPQMFGLHPNAETGFLTNQGMSIFKTVQAISGGGGAGGGGDISTVGVHITNFLNQLPCDLDMIEIRGRLKDEDYTPYVIVSLQESDRMNILVQAIRNSLLELELGISGALNITDKMEALAKCLGLNQVFPVWDKLAYPTLKSLAVWFADLLLRMEQLVEWTTVLTLLKSLWISGFFNAMAFITSVMQTTSRATMQPLDFMRQRSRFLNVHDHNELPGLPADGVHVHGMFMEGAGWEEGKGEDEGYITDSKMKELHPYMPVNNMISLHVDEMSWEAMYHCPCFITSLRRGPEKGAPDFVFLANVRMDPDDDEKRWVLAGGALLFTDE